MTKKKKEDLIKNNNMKKVQNIYDNKDFFDAYKEMRDTKINANELIEMPTIKEMLPDLKDTTILDLGCGTGFMLNEIKKIYKLKNKNLDLYGLDISEEMIKIANENLNGKANLKVGDSEYIPWKDNTFDLVVCNASFHHFSNPEKTLFEIKRVLNSNGILILGDPTAPIILRDIFNLFIKYSDSGDYRIYNQKEIEELFKLTGFIPKNFKLLKRNKFFINGEVSKD